jgi:transcriptional regulator with XRE-family HTH domain
MCQPANFSRESEKVLNVTRARQRRKELGLTMAQVADLCGVGTGVVSRWEAGKREPRNSDSLRAWARALQLEPAELVNEEDLLGNGEPATPRGAA